MRNTIEDRLVLLAKAQESMTDVADIMTRWDNSQLIMEKSAFESLNVSDEVLNLSREGSLLVGRLLECCRSLMKNPSPEESRKMAAVLEEIHEVFFDISQASSNVNDISHRIEAEAESQKEMEEEIRSSLARVGESLDSAIACAELVLAEC
jgi:hypothetical protein